jgi:hypothetical protein
MYYPCYRRGFLFCTMKRSLLPVFFLMVGTFLLLRWQGNALVTPASSRGILDLEFAGNTNRLYQLKLFWNGKDVNNNIYLDFLFIAAYAAFLMGACQWIREKSRHTKRAELFTRIALAAGIFDIVENLLMLVAWNDGAGNGTMKLIYYCAAIKFLLAGLVVLYLVYSLPVLLRKRNGLPN